MKKLPFFFISYLLSIASFSQEGTSIIFQNGDTLLNSKIHSKYQETNSQKLTFEENGEVKTVSVDKISAYWDGEKYFSSKQTVDGGKYFINLILSGPLTLGEYVNESGRFFFTVKLEGEERFRIIPNTGPTLNPFFDSFLPQYAEYIEKYPTPIYIVYTRKSIGEFVSRYNQFRNPEKYKFTKFKHEKKFYIGLSLLGTSNSYSTDLGSFESGKTSNISFGLSGRISITPKLSFMGVLGKVKSDSNEGLDKLVINSTFFEGHAQYSLTNSSKLSVLLSPNFTIFSNSDSSFDISRNTPTGVFIDSYKLEPITTGYGLNIIFLLPSQKINLGILVGIGKRSINSGQNDFVNNKSYYGNSNMIRYGLLAEF